MSTPRSHPTQASNKPRIMVTFAHTAQQPVLPSVTAHGIERQLNFTRTNLQGTSYRRASQLPSVFANIKLPSIVDYRNTLPPIKDQGTKPICGGISGATVLEYKVFQNTGVVSEPLSGDYIHSHRSNPQQAGMSGIDIMNSMTFPGACTDRTWNAIQTTPNNAALAVEVHCESEKHRIRHGVFVDSLELMKIALFQNGPAVFASPCFNGSSTYWKPDAEQLVHPEHARMFGHAVTAVGYDDIKQAFCLRNSWGKGWNENGYTWFPYADWELWHWETWTCLGDVCNTDMGSNGYPVPSITTSLRTMTDFANPPTNASALMLAQQQQQQENQSENKSNESCMPQCGVSCVIQ